MLIKNKVKEIESREEKIELWKENFVIKELLKLLLEPKSTNTSSIKEKSSKTLQTVFFLIFTEDTTELTQTNSSVQLEVSYSNFTTLSTQSPRFTLMLISALTTKRNKKIQKQKRYKSQITHENFYSSSSLSHSC